jgi:hypothetical protein
MTYSFQTLSRILLANILQERVLGSSVQRTARENCSRHNGESYLMKSFWKHTLMAL